MRKWLHVLGYFCTAIVLCEIVLFAYGAIRATIKQQQIVEAFKDASRTRSTLLGVGKCDVVCSDAVRMLHRLPPQSVADKSGFRFVAMPSFSREWYVLSISDGQTGTARGLLAVVKRDDSGQLSSGNVQEISIPGNSYVRLKSQIENIAKNFSGDVESCFDGTPVAFELADDTRVMSGVGSATCGGHYRAISAAVLNGIRPFIGVTDLPPNYDWMPQRMGK